MFRIYGYSVRWIAKVKRSGENLAWIGVTEIDFSKIIGGINGVKDCFGYGYSVRWIVKVKRSGENLAWIGVTEIDFSKIIGGYQRGKGLFRIYGYSVRWIVKIKRSERYSTLISIQWE